MKTLFNLYINGNVNKTDYDIFIIMNYISFFFFHYYEIYYYQHSLPPSPITIIPAVLDSVVIVNEIPVTITAQHFSIIIFIHHERKAPQLF